MTPPIEQARPPGPEDLADEAAPPGHPPPDANPDDAAALLQRARQEMGAGRARVAVGHLQQLLGLQPDHAEALNDLAMALSSLGQDAAALECIDEAVRRQPRSANVWNNRGGLLEALGRLDEAIEAYRRAVELTPFQAVPRFNLGDALRQVRRLDEAAAELRLAATLDPQLQPAWAALGTCALELGQPEAALGPLRQALALNPDDATACRRCADALFGIGEREAATARYEQAVALDPQQVEAWYGLGRVLASGQRTVEAMAAFRRGLALDAGHAPCLHELGKALFGLGSVEQAMPLLRQAAARSTGADLDTALLNLAVIAPGSPDEDNRSILQARQDWARQFPSQPPRSPRRRDGAGPLRVGYCSSFFTGANWMKPVWALVNHHQREQFEIYLFSDGPAEGIGADYHRHPGDRFFDIGPLSNEAAAACIAAQDLDLLVDLNGYSAPKRLPLYALRPAPILAGWFNLYATSGFDCFDYLIGDPHVIPGHETPWYTERVLRLPHSYLVFEVYHPAPPVAPTPMLGSGQLTLGCLASQYKITDQVVSSWAEILRRCPGVRLLIRNAGMGRADRQAHLRERFAACGVAPDRLLLEGPAEHRAFLQTYDRIDVALDPFPYSGGTTTMEALWQGVPVLTFDGDRWASRTSVSILRAAGLDEFVATDRQDYIERCVSLVQAGDTAGRLQALREGMRERLRASPVCDAAGQARSMEALYRQIIADGPRPPAAGPAEPPRAGG